MAFHPHRQNPEITGSPPPSTPPTSDINKQQQEQQQEQQREACEVCDARVGVVECSVPAGVRRARDGAGGLQRKKGR
jgi:hypothetical protein